MSDLTHLSLFSGIGGLDLAAEMAGFRTVGQCEWADYPRAVLEKHWPGLPRWRDIRTLTGEDFYERTGLRTATVLSGGFPCQPFSTAGKRRGKDDDRYLWPEMLRVIQEIRPAWVVGENVAGIVSMALDTVLSDLENIGYTTQAFVIPACAVDAPHKRDRVAIVSWNSYGGKVQKKPKIQGRTYPITSGVCQDVSNTNDRGRNVRRNGELSAVEGPGTGGNDFRGGTPEHGGREWRPAEPVVGGMATRISDRMDGGMSTPGYWLDEPEGVPRIASGVPKREDRLKCLGNAVVPQQFYPIFRAIADLED